MVWERKADFSLLRGARLVPRHLIQDRFKGEALPADVKVALCRISAPKLQFLCVMLKPSGRSY